MDRRTDGPTDGRADGRMRCEDASKDNLRIERGKNVEYGKTKRKPSSGDTCDLAKRGQNVSKTDVRLNLTKRPSKRPTD